MTNKNYLAIDYGTKKSGLAYNSLSFCFAYKTVSTTHILDILKKILWEKNIHAIILGMPYNIDGTMSSHGKRVQNFAKKLEIFNLPIIFHDERLTTSEARIAFSEHNFHGDIDTESARLILEDFLENSESHLL